MENAAKALIIAGAILLAILIIGLGVFIYNQAANTVGDTGMDQLAVRQFNGQFEHYLGRQLSSTAAKSLLDTIELNNRTNGEDKQVRYNRGLNIQFGHKYNVEAEYDGGVIVGIAITDTSSGGAVIAGAKETKENSSDRDEEPIIKKEAEKKIR